MSNIKKIIGVVLALVMALSVATVAFAAPGDAYSVTVTADKATIAAGESATVTVKVTANFNVSAMSIPVFFDNSQVTASAGETTLANANIATETSTNVEAYFEGSGHTKDDYGIRALIYLAPYGAAIKSYANEAVMTFTVTANDDATGAVVLECISTAVKTSSNPSGTLYVTKNGSGNATVDSLGEVIDAADVTGATATVNIASAAEPADLAVKTAYASSGIIIDTNKTFGGKYDGVVYGFELSGTINVAFYTTRLEATNGGSITIEKTPYVSRPVSYGTGATVQVMNADGTLSKTYVIVIFGDVSGNGKIGAEDTGAIYNHVQGKALITDEVQVMAANLVESGRTAALKATSLYQIKADDTGAVYEAVQGTKAINQGSLAIAHNTYNTYYQ